MPESQRSARTATVVALYAPKAGVGTSVIACNLAVALRALSGTQVILVDGNLELGSVATLLGLAPRPGIGDSTNLDNHLVEHASGVRALLASGRRADSAARLDPETLLQAARERAGFVVVDTVSGTDPFADPLLVAAARIVLVLTPESAAVRHGREFLRLAAERGLAEHVRVVVNRYQSDASLPVAEIEQAFGARVIGRLGSFGPFVLDSVNAGRPFVESAPDHPLSSAVFELARALMKR